MCIRDRDWALREMKHEGGAFYSALDAESESIEGKYYRWERDEIKQLLGANYQAYAEVYGLDDEPNLEEFHVAQLTKPIAETAKAKGTTEPKLWQQLQPMHAELLAVRDKRPRPLTDTKILASWNGLFIRGLADAGRVLDRADYVQAAADAANFVLMKMRTEDGRLYRTHTAGESKLNAYLDDLSLIHI